MILTDFAGIDLVIGQAGENFFQALLVLSAIVFSTAGVLLGLMVGVTAFRHPAFERAITPLLDLMQTVPVFAYLVPILFLFGFGPVAAMLGTIIYAMGSHSKDQLGYLLKTNGQITEEQLQESGDGPGRLLQRVLDERSRDPLRTSGRARRVGKYHRVLAEIDGVLRGLIRSGSQVTEGLKIGDIDPRGEVSYCFTISDRARAIGGSVLEAILRSYNGS